MSDTPTPEAQAPQAWSDDDIRAAVKQVAHNVLPDMRTQAVTAFQAENLMARVRHSLSTTIATQAARIAELEGAINGLNAQVAQLERKLSVCGEYADKMRGEKAELAEQLWRQRVGLPEKDRNDD